MRYSNIFQYGFGALHMVNARVFIAFSLLSSIVLHSFSACAGDIYTLDEIFSQTRQSHTSMGAEFEKATHIIAHGTYDANKSRIKINGWSYDNQPLVLAYDKSFRASVGGMPVVLKVHHFKDSGLDIYINWGSFEMRRQIFQSSNDRCNDIVNFSLRPGHKVFIMPDNNKSIILVTGMALTNYYCEFHHYKS